MNWLIFLFTDWHRCVRPAWTSARLFQHTEAALVCQNCLVNEAAAASQCWRLCLFQCGFSFQESEIQQLSSVENLHFLFS